MRMNTIADTGARQGSVVAPLIAGLKHACATFMAWRVQQAAIAYLRSMTDRELKDIGLPRAEIEVAVTGSRASTTRRAAPANF